MVRFMTRLQSALRPGVGLYSRQTQTSRVLRIRQRLTHVLNHRMASRRVRHEQDPDMMDVSDDDQADGNGGGGIESVEHMSKALVRYALSCEHSRRPIKRQDINEKGLHVNRPLTPMDKITRLLRLTAAVLGSHTRLFKQVFAQANSQLMDVFGMQLVELPKAERVTLRQKRAAAAASLASDSQTKSTSVWVLQSVLPSQYRIPEIVGPSRPLEDGSLNKEDAYVGLYTLTIALITISGGMIPEGKLDRALRRMNAEQNTPVGTKDKALATMVKDGYIVRVKETSGAGDETVDYIVGPRGKVEVGRDGVAQFIRAMHGDAEDEDELERRIQRTLNVADAHSNSAPAADTQS